MVFRLFGARCVSQVLALKVVRLNFLLLFFFFFFLFKEYTLQRGRRRPGRTIGIRSDPHRHHHHLAIEAKLIAIGILAASKRHDPRPLPLPKHR
jgi:hypothetical protein